MALNNLESKLLDSLKKRLLEINSDNKEISCQLEQVRAP